MKTVLNLIPLAAVLHTAPELPAANATVERQTYAMGTVLTARATAPDRPSAIAALEAAFAEVRRLEDLLSGWRTDTELARINEAPVGTPLQISPELADLLSEAFGWSARTGGAFDPAIGPLIDAWDLRGEGRRPTRDELALARARAGLAHFDLEGRILTRRIEGAWLDTGGFGKGLALRAARRVLREGGVRAAYLDFGGQILVFGDGPDTGGSWELGIAHPMDRAAVATTIALRSGSVATSGQSERYVEAAGERLGHIVDPRTGLPVEPWGSVTVVADDPFVADVLATALFVMGPGGGRAWAESFPEIGVVFHEDLGTDIRRSWNPAFEKYLLINSMPGEH